MRYKGGDAMHDDEFDEASYDQVIWFYGISLTTSFNVHFYLHNIFQRRLRWWNQVRNTIPKSPQKEYMHPFDL